MTQIHLNQLRASLEAEATKGPLPREFKADATTVFMGAGSPWSGAHSYAGNLHGPGVSSRLQAFAGKVGDYPRWYVPFRKDRFRYSQLHTLKKRFSDLQVVDFSGERRFIARHEKICRAAGVKLFTFTQAMHALDLTPVYETPASVRAKTVENMDRFIAQLDLLEDELSKVTLLSVLLHRLTLDRRFLDGVFCEEKHEYFSSEAAAGTLTLGSDECFCDLGAAKGEVIRKFLRTTKRKYRAIHAFEPDRNNFQRLTKLKDSGVRDLHLYNAAIGAKAGTTAFLETGSYSSHAVDDGGVRTPVVCLDDVVDAASLIKMDIEGAEPDAIRGGARLIQRLKPKMAICVYHYATDLVEITSLLTQIRPDYRYRLRQHSLNFWDTVLYAC